MEFRVDFMNITVIATTFNIMAESKIELKLGGSLGVNLHRPNHFRG